MRTTEYNDDGLATMERDECAHCGASIFRYRSLNEWKPWLHNKGWQPWFHAARGADLPMRRCIATTVASPLKEVDSEGD